MEFQENLHVFKKVRIEFLFVVIRCVFDTYYKKVLLFLLLFFFFLLLSSCFQDPVLAGIS